jgi:hypothetical protein
MPVVALVAASVLLHLTLDDDYDDDDDDDDADEDDNYLLYFIFDLFASCFNI